MITEVASKMAAAIGAFVERYPPVEERLIEMTLDLGVEERDSRR